MKTHQRLRVIATLVLSAGMSIHATSDPQSVAREYPLTTCVVSGMRLGSMGDPYVHKVGDQEVRFCCKGCLPRFEKNPDRYLKALVLPKPSQNMDDEGHGAHRRHQNEERIPSAEGPRFDDAAQHLLKTHPALSAARNQAEAASYHAIHADALPDPSLTVGHFVESVQTRTGPQETTFQLSQRLPWFGVREQRSTTARALAASLANRESQIGLKLGGTLADAFYEYAYIGQATRLTEDNLRLLRDLQPIVETKVAAGASLNSLLRLNVESAKLADRMETLAARRLELSAALDALLGDSVQQPRPWPAWASPSTNSFHLAEMTARLLQQNPAILAQDRQLAALKGKEALAKLEGYPSFSLGLNYIQVGDPGGTPSPPDAGEDPWGVQAAIRIPLWRGDQKARQAEASTLRRVEEHRRAEVVRSLTAELRQHIALHADAVRRLNLYGGELLGLAQQAVENSRAGYENGHATILELIDSERSLLALELEYWRAVADTHIHHVHILCLTHTGLESLLASRELP